MRFGSTAAACLIALGSAEARGAAASPVVEIEVTGSAAAVERLKASAVESLARLGVTAQVGPRVRGAPRNTESPPLARVYVDLDEPTQPELVIVDGRSRRELSRRSLPASTSLETSIEAVSLVVYMVVQGLLVDSAERAAGGDGSSAVEPAPPNGPETGPPRAGAAAGEDAVSAPVQAAPARATQKPRPAGAATRSEAGVDRPSDDELASQPAAGARGAGGSGLAFGGGALLRLATLDNERALTGAGVSLEAWNRGWSAPRFGACVFVAGHWPTEVGHAGAAAELTVVSLRAMPAVATPLGGSVTSLLAAGGGVDWLHTAGDADSGVASSPAVVDAVLSVLAGLRLTLAPALSLSAAASLDVDLAPRRFVALEGEARHELLALSRVRPSLLLGISTLPASARGRP